jgi:LuxR family maltose regulon positive regulatory protein
VLVALAPLVASTLRELRRAAEIAELRRLVQLADAPDRQLQARALAQVDAQAAWAAGDLERAATLLREADERSRGVEVVLMPEAGAELAVLLAEQGRLERAVRALEPVLDRIAPTRAWARVAQSGRALVPVLQAVAPARREAAAATLALLDGAAAPEPRAVPGSPEVLTSREVEVLRELATGASNQEIGGRLHLSENTVKTHVKRVLSKLEVPSRTAAVARARQLGLL